jgi:hypothetical protein
MTIESRYFSSSFFLRLLSLYSCSTALTQTKVTFFRVFWDAFLKWHKSLFDSLLMKVYQY